MAKSRRRYDDASRIVDHSGKAQQTPSERLQDDTKNEMKRQRVMLEFKAKEKTRLGEMHALMQRKEDLMQQKMTLRANKTADWQEAARLKTQERSNYVERIRRSKHFAKTQALGRIERANERMNELSDLHLAIQDYRGDTTKAAIIQNHKWKDEYGTPHILPGPGEYERGSTLTPSGGVWGKYRPKSDIEWQIHHAASMPGPAEYELGGLMAKGNGGTFSRSRHKTTTAQIIENSEGLP